MTQTIRVLPPELANQIAAGEVVERPASVVKELLENSLDAGSRRVDIAIAQGGVERIEIADDGSGMSPKDARLALERHATSKLRAFADLEQLVSYGFRGEALPSIASVSQFSLTTRNREFESGSELRAGKRGRSDPSALEIVPTGSAIGTRIVVADLFYNVPARRKFLRSSATEAGHVGEVVDNAALCRPDVAFTLRRDGRLVKNYARASSRLERVTQVLGADTLWEAGGTRGPLTVEAFLAPPERARTGSGGLVLILNRRPIKDRALAATLAHAYAGRLERGRYPRGVVYLELDPALVDINVHPQKTEVRFADGRAVAEAVHAIVAAALSERLPTEAPGPRAEAAPPSAAERPAGRFVHHKAWPLRERTEHPSAAAQERGEAGAPAAPASERSATRTAPAGAAGAGESVPGRAGSGWKRLRFVARARARFLWCEGEDGFYLLDAWQLHRLVLERELLRDHAERRAKSQSLLFPLTLEAHAESVQALEAQGDVCRGFGLDLRARSERAVSVHALPLRLERLRPELVAQILLEELARPAAPERLVARSAERLASADVARLREVPGELDAAQLVRHFAELDFDDTERQRAVLGFDSYAGLAENSERA